MYTNPRIVPHEMVHDDSTPSGDKVHEIDCNKYGDAWDPETPMRVFIAKDWAFDPDQDGHV